MKRDINNKKIKFQLYLFYCFNQNKYITHIIMSATILNNWYFLPDLCSYSEISRILNSLQDLNKTSFSLTKTEYSFKFNLKISKDSVLTLSIWKRTGTSSYFKSLNINFIATSLDSLVLVNPRSLRIGYFKFWINL